MTNFDKVIPPGSEGKIFAKVDPSHSEGAVQKSIDIKSNDPATPVTRVSIKAVVKSLVNIAPEMVRFDVLKGALESQDILLTPDPSVKLLKATVDSPLITAELVPQKNGKQKLTVHMKQSEIIGTQATEVKIAASGALKEVSVPVVIAVRGPLQVSPQIVSFQLTSFPEVVSANAATGLRKEPTDASAVSQKISAGEQLHVMGESEGWYQVYTAPIASSENSDEEAYGEPGWIAVKSTKAVKPPEFPEPVQIQIQSSGKKPFQVLGLKSTLPSVKVERNAKAQSSSLFVFTATLQKTQAAKKQRMQGEIIVQTDHPDQPQVRIPLYVIFG